MKTLLKSMTCALSAVLSIANVFYPPVDGAAATLSQQAEQIKVSIGKVCVSMDELAENDYKVSVPITIFGAQDGFSSFDSTYIAFNDIKSGNQNLEIGNVTAQKGELAIEQSGVLSDKFNITSVFDFTEQNISAFSISGYSHEAVSGDNITVCELSFSVPQTAQLGDVYNIVWYDELNEVLLPTYSSWETEYLTDFVDGLIYIGSLSTQSNAQFDDMYFADNTESITEKVSLFINQGTEFENTVDISEYISLGKDVLSSRDVDSVSAGNSGVSPFDLYWAAKDENDAQFVFEGDLLMSKLRFSEFCDSFSQALGFELDGQTDYIFFKDVLFDDELEPLSLGFFSFRIGMRGDANLDHFVDTKDAAAISSYDIKLSALPSGAQEPVMSDLDDALAKFVADTNEDRAIDTKDAANVSKYDLNSASYGSATPAALAYYSIWKDLGAVG